MTCSQCGKETEGRGTRVTRSVPDGPAGIMGQRTRLDTVVLCGDCKRERHDATRSILAAVALLFGVLLLIAVLRTVF